jgi:hypothetical protein
MSYCTARCHLRIANGQYRVLTKSTASTGDAASYNQCQDARQGFAVVCAPLSLLIFTTCEPDSWHSPRNKRIMVTGVDYVDRIRKRAGSGCVIHRDMRGAGRKEAQKSFIAGGSLLGPRSTPSISQCRSPFQSWNPTSWVLKIVKEYVTQ